MRQNPSRLRDGDDAPAVRHVQNVFGTENTSIMVQYFGGQAAFGFLSCSGCYLSSSKSRTISGDFNKRFGSGEFKLESGAERSFK